MGIFLSLIYLQFATVYAVEAFDFTGLDHTAVSYKVIVKNVGQGSCTILKNQSNGNIVIIDAGSSANTPFELDDQITKELGGASIAEDIPPINGDITLIVSHTDQDHIDRLHRVFSKNVRIFAHSPYILLGDNLANYYKSTDSRLLLRRIVGNLKDPSRQSVSLSHNISLSSAIVAEETDDLIDVAAYHGYREHIPIDRFLSRDQNEMGHVFEILSANAGASTKDIRDENTNSAIVRLCINGKNILIMGDATGLTTQRILLTPQNRAQLETELLISSHHGSRSDETNNGLWLSTTKPKHVAISAGYHGKYRHPRAEFLIDLMIINSLDKSAPHDLALSGEEENFEFYKQTLATYFTLKDDLEFKDNKTEKIHKWLNFEVSRSVHNTGSSGDLYYFYNTTGDLVHFWQEN